MKELLLLPFRRFAMWMVWSDVITLGRFAPRLFDFAMGQKGKRVSPLTQQEGDDGQ